MPEVFDQAFRDRERRAGRVDDEPLVTEQEFHDRVLSSLGKITSTLVGVQRTLDRVDAAVYGNGTPGLQDRVARIEERADALRDSSKRRADTRAAIFGAGGALLGTLITLASARFT